MHTGTRASGMERRQKVSAQMVSRYALMFDGGSRGPRKALAEHLTCRACQGHHVVPIDALAANGYRFRSAEQSRFAQSGLAVGPHEIPTHQCRDCGSQWTGTGAAPV